MKRFWKILPVLLLAVLLLAACGAGGAEETTAPQVDPETLIYYNLEQGERRAADPHTGLYTVRLSAEGQTYEFYTGREQILELLDREMFLGVTLDDQGNIFGIKRLRDLGGSVAVENKTVTAIEENVITLSGRGGSDTITLQENTAIYDMTGWEGQKGVYGHLQEKDQIYALKDTQGQIIAVYVMQRQRIHEDSHLCDCCQQEVTWLAWDPTAELTDGGHYYVDGDMNVGKTVQLAGKEVTLCLNSATVKSTSCIWVLTEGAHLKIVDHADDSGASHGYLIGGGYDAKNPAYEKMNGGTIRVADETSKLTLLSGNLSVQLPASGVRTVKHGGVIDNQGTVDLRGGAVTGGTSGLHGGNIYNAGVLNIYDGALVTGGYAPGDGGNIYTDAGVLNLAGGLITDGKCDDEGGNICIVNLDVTMVGGTVQNGSAVKGGNICVRGKSGETQNVFTLKDGTVTGGLAVFEKYPGGSYVDSDGKSSTAYPTGGNIWVTSGQKVRIEGGVVSEGYADHCGGNLGATGGTLEIVGGSSIGGLSAYAGNIYLSDSAKSILIIRGGSIVGGELDTRKFADGTGPCIRLQKSAKLILSGSPTITEIHTMGAEAFDAIELEALKTPIRIEVLDQNKPFALVPRDMSSSFTCENGMVYYKEGAGLFVKLQQTPES